MFVSGVNSGVMAQQYLQPMKASDYDHVIHTMPRSRSECDYLTCGQQSNIAISVLNNNTNNINTPRQAANNQIPAMRSPTTDSLKPEIEILPLSYSDCQLSSAVYSSLHHSGININDGIHFTRNVPKSFDSERHSCQMKAPEMASSSCRLLEQSNIPPNKPSPLGQLRLPTIKVTDNVAANVMSEEHDVGYFSFSDISSFQELTDVMNCSDESDEIFCDSNFSDIIEDVLDSLDQNSQSGSIPQNSLEYSEKSLANVQSYKYPTTHQIFSPDSEQYHAMPNPPSQQYFDHPPMKWYTPGQFLAMSASSAFPKQTMELRCELCNKCFQTKASLRVHMRQHRGERPHQCTQCKKTFTQKSTLRTHIRTHTGERPYNCDFCSRAFGDYSTYRKHVRVHTGEKPYACDICKKTFTQSGNMIRHRMVHFKKHGLSKK